MNLILWILIFIVSIYFLVKAADYFTDYAECLGKILKMPNFIVGVVIVAIGTSLPEFSTSMASIFQGQTEMVASNVIGTVIANILLGLGIAVLLAKKIVKFDWDLISNDMPIFMTTIILAIFTMYDGQFTFYEALIMLIGFVIYIIYTRTIHKQNKYLDKTCSTKLTWKIPAMLIGSLAVIFIASKFTIDSVIAIATILGLGTSVLAASIIAVGTSLPEITVAVTAARKGKFDMVIGDIMGSNIFDILFIFGVGGLFTTLPIDNKMLYLGLPFMFCIALVQWLALTDKKLTKIEAGFMLLIYILFLGKLFEFI